MPVDIPTWTISFSVQWRELSFLELDYKAYLAKMMGTCSIVAFFSRLGDQFSFAEDAKGAMIYHGLIPNTWTYLIFKIWENVPKPFIERLYNSMPARIGAVIKTKGFMTKY